MAGETPETLSFGRYLTTLELRPGGDRELAVGVPAVHAVHPAHGLVHPEGLAGVQAAGRGGRRVGQGAARRRHAARRTRRCGRGPAAGALVVYSNSLVLVMAVIWIWSWLAQSVSGWSEYNAERIEHEQPPLSWLGYLGSAGLLGDDAAELAVGVPRGRLDGGARDLPAAARLAGVQAGRRAPPLDVGGGIRCPIHADRPPARHEDRGAEGADARATAARSASTPAGRPSTGGSTSATRGRSSSSRCSSGSSRTRATSPTLVANITDINDKIYDAARPAGRPLGRAGGGDDRPLHRRHRAARRSAGPTTSRARR